MARISLGMIVRDEGETLERCLQSIRPVVDEIVIGLGGRSTDNTNDIVAKYADKVLDIEWNGHFADARNVVLKETSGDYFMWLDGDDEVVGAQHIRDIVESHPEVDAFYAYYDYGHDDQNNSVQVLGRERIVRADRGYRWVGRVHECLVSEESDLVITMMPNVVIRHQPSKKVRGNRNLELLYRELEDTEPNPTTRVLMYLGNEEAIRGRHDIAIMHWKRYMKLTEWNEESYQVQHKIADSHRAMGDLDRAEQADYAAIRINPAWPDAYYGLAATASARKEWRAVVEWTMAGQTKEPPQTFQIINPFDYTFWPLITLGQAYVGLQDYDAARRNYLLALRVRREPDIAKLVRDLDHLIKNDQLAAAFLTVAKHLGQNDEWLKLRKLFGSVPKALEGFDPISDLWARVEQNTAHVDHPEIMAEFYKNNPHWAPMDSDTILSEQWLDYPRLKFAIDTADRIGAQTIVDLGCSDGFMSLPLARKGYKVDGVDLDPRCTALATERAIDWNLDHLTSFTEGDLSVVTEWAACENFEKYDLAILFETLEHVVDPRETLTQVESAARHVAITTPYLAWENGNIPEWDKLEPKGHLRIFDLLDIEALLNSRGRIHNLYRQPWGDDHAWIFADYEVGGTSRHRVEFVCPPALEPWGPRKLANEGIGGSETATIRLAEAFFKQDCRVTVYNDIDEPGYYSGVAYRPVRGYSPYLSSDLSIAWRYPEAGDNRPNTRTHVLWMHDTDAGNRLTKERAENFDFFVVLSDWHRRHFIRSYPFIPVDKVLVIGNGVDRNRFRTGGDGPTRRSNRVLFTSSPDRGLDTILEGIWPRVLEAVPDAELHYYYGWNSLERATGMAPHLADFQRRVGELTLATKNVVSHGRLPQDQLAKELLQGSIWLYPTYFHETYCISAIEAQLAGLLPVYNPLAALQETVASGIAIKGDVHDKRVQQQYAEAVIHALLNPPTEAERQSIARGAPYESWDDIATAWIQNFLGAEEVVGANS